MKQIFQNLGNGKTTIEETPCPSLRSNSVLVETSMSLVSIGTERMLIDFGKSNLLKKAKSQPDKVKEVLQKIKSDGLVATKNAVNTKLQKPMPLGYCNVGKVIQADKNCFAPGTRVVSNGSHAEIVCVSKNLVAIIPDEVADETASFTVLGAIALQGIRLIHPTIGETIVVTGLGLIGLMAVQILIASGCTVVAIDFDPEKCTLAEEFGARAVNLASGEDPIEVAKKISNNIGVDAVLITASSESHEIVHQAVNMCRKRGRVVLIGVVGLNLQRSDFYEKEVTFQVSCSYGPGRYDKQYEDMGQDYPISFVRWTAQRNFNAVLALMASKKVKTEELITKSYLFEDSLEAYKEISNESNLGVLLRYKPDLNERKLARLVELRPEKIESSDNQIVSFVGGGNYASQTLIPAFQASGVNFGSLVTSGGFGSLHLAKKYKFRKATTDILDAFEGECGSIVIATQHHLHASQVISALKHDKHVFVEKPLALNANDLSEIKEEYYRHSKVLMIGFNRRFSPLILKMKTILIKNEQPKSFVYTINAGFIKSDHWTQDKDIGGGRIVGECVHFIDLLKFLTDAKITNVQAIKLGGVNDFNLQTDTVIINLKFSDGSIGVINYFANGGKSFPKERLEVFFNNSVLQIDNFRKLTGFGVKNFNSMNLWSQDKGQKRCALAFVDAIKHNRPSPIPFEEILEVSLTAIEIEEMLGLEEV